MQLELLDINRTSIDNLTSVDGVSTPVAEAIVDYIETHGPVETINELENIEGVGPATIDKLKATFGAKVKSAPETSLAIPVGFRPQFLFEYWWNQSRISLQTFQSVLLARSMRDVMATQQQFLRLQTELFSRTVQRAFRLDGEANAHSQRSAMRPRR
ncbi:MAG: hypothetical protein APF80_16535 [Alphaproteobacteria bacterium BRH_c36]|nr:MAG: hypothetical protein APF80_16535 [Alphaproteobacteria bacterium BRH_c36]